MHFEARAFSLPNSFDVEKYGQKKQILFNLSRGPKPQIILFWATWCGFCKDYTKVLDKYLPLIKSKNVSMIAFSADDVKRDGSKGSKVSYSQFESHYWLPEDTKKLLRLEVLPVMVLIDSKGVVDTIYIGSQGDKLSYFEKRLKLLFGINDES